MVAFLPGAPASSAVFFAYVPFEIASRFWSSHAFHEAASPWRLTPVSATSASLN